jgi:micrococcal nuclease
MNKNAKDLIITAISLSTIISATVWYTTNNKSGDKSGLFTQQVAPPLTEQWTVIKVSDGDTMTVRQTTGQEMKIRLACIDAPEIPDGNQPGQPLGEESKVKLQSLVAAADNQVMVIPIEKDKYGRTVAEIMSAGKNGIEVSFQEEMLKSGMAYLYRQYLKKCFNASAFEQAQKIAIASRAGVWNNPSLERPWDYRRRYK